MAFHSQVWAGERVWCCLGYSGCFPEGRTALIPLTLAAATLESQIRSSNNWNGMRARWEEKKNQSTKTEVRRRILQKWAASFYKGDVLVKISSFWLPFKGIFMGSKKPFALCQSWCFALSPLLKFMRGKWIFFLLFLEVCWGFLVPEDLKKEGMYPWLGDKSAAPGLCLLLLFWKWLLCISAIKCPVCISGKGRVA